MIIGLTGGIASGKSTVSNMIKELEIPVIDADIIAREVVEIGGTAYAKIVDYFGREILNETGSLNRKKLGAIVFNNEEKRLVLNGIVHPAVRIRMNEKIEEQKKIGNKAIVLDIPLLFESKLTYLVDKIIVVFVDQEIQKQRLKSRDQFSEEEALARIASQMPLKEKLALADEVIHNHGLLGDTREQLMRIFKKWNCL
jgi:dephospho-CoA kinase